MMLAFRRCPRNSRPACHRTYASTTSLPGLPPPKLWRKTFPSNSIARRDRVSISDPILAKRVAQSFLTGPQSRTSESKVVIEAFPGPGALSRAMLQLPSSVMKKLIILEDDELYLEYLRPLQDADPRVTVVPMTGHQWDTYNYLEEQGIMADAVRKPWDSGLPNLHFVSHLPQNVYGEQLIAQLYRNIPEHSWLFRYGRMPMSFLMSDLVWTRLTGPPGQSKRCKMSVIGEATSEFFESPDPEELAPYEDHFHPETARKKASSKSPGQPMHAVTTVPYAEQIIQKGQIDSWDYCIRRLFILKSTPLKDAIGTLGPGSKSLVNKLTDPSLPRAERVNVTKRVRDLNVADWTIIVRAFNEWPFKPSDLLVTGGFMGEEAY